MAAQERAEDADWRAVRLAKLRGLAHEPAVEGQRFDAPRLERSLDARVERLCAAFVAAAPEDTAGLRLRPRAAMIASSAWPLTISSRAPRAARASCIAVSDSARRHFAAPPKGRAPAAGLIVDIDEERGLLRGGVNRRLVVKAEIVTQPDDVDAFAHGPASASR